MSPKVRLLAIAGFVAALALGAGLLLLGKSQGSSSAAPIPTIHRLYPRKHHARSHRAVLHPRAKAPAAPKTKPKHVRRTPAVVDGMPAALAYSLSTHQVVVVALYAPGSSVDALAYAEARAGAASVGAGFVGINVLKERQSHALTNMLASQSPDDRLLDDPAVLVFQQPKTLFVRLNGFADRDTVAQAAQNAVPLAASP